MSRRTAAIVAWTLVTASAVLGFTGEGFLIAVDGVEGWHFVSNDVLAMAVFGVSAVVGALVASRLPENPIGWLLAGPAVVLGLSGLADGYVALSLDRGHDGALVPWAAWYSSKVFLAFFTMLFFVPLLFPDGRLPTRRWRVVLWTGAAALLLSAVGVLLNPGKLDEHRQLTNPVGVDSPVVGWCVVVGLLLFCASLVGAAASVVVRFRRARGVERQQLTLLAAAGVVAATTFIVGGAAGAWVAEDLGIAVTLLGVLTIPVAIGVAMLRYRLYDVDRVVSRTLAYAALTVILGAAYVGLVLAGQAVFSSFAGGSDLVIAGSTLVVAALFLPLRSRVQRVVDRRFYRRRYDTQQTLEAFGARLREQVELDGLRADLLGVVRETMQPASTTLWLREPGEAS